MWLGQATPGNPRKCAGRRPPSPSARTYPATPSCLASGGVRMAPAAAFRRLSGRCGVPRERCQRGCCSHAKWAATGTQVCCSRFGSGSCRCVRSGAAVRVSPPGAGEPGTCAYRGPSGAGTPSCLHTAAASPGPISLPVPFRVCRGSADTCPSGPRHLACFAPPTSRQPFSRRCRSRSRRFTQRRTADARRRRSRCARQAPRRA